MKTYTLFAKILFRPLALICCLTPLQSNAQIVVGSNGADETISTDFTGDQTLTKVGSNVVTLTGTNSYTGPTLVNDGTLRAGANQIFASGPDNFMTLDGGTFDLNGTTQSIGGFTVRTGTHTQSNGSLTGVWTYGFTSSGTISLAPQAGDEVVYNMTGGSLISSPNSVFFIGHGGDATFNQTGGLVESGAHLFIGAGSGRAVYNLLGGTLQLTDSEAGWAAFLGDSGLGPNAGTLTVGRALGTSGGVFNAPLFIEDGGTLIIKDGGTVNRGVALAGTGKIIFDRDENYLNFPQISGRYSGSVVKNGTGTVSLAGYWNDWEGGTTVNAGTLSVAGRMANKLANVITVNSGATFVLNNDNLFGAITNLNILTPLVINGGTVSNGGNFYSTLGAITLNGGTLLSTGVNPTNGLAFSLRPSVTVNSNSTIAGPGIGLGAGGSSSQTATTFSVASNVTLNVTGNLENGVGLRGAGRNNGRLIKAGAGTMILSGTNTYVFTTIDGGTLQVGNGGATGNLGSSNVLNNASLVFDRSDAGLVVSGNISGAGTVTQAGSGTTTLSGSNSYTGLTAITNGVLRSGTNRSLSSGSRFTLNGGTLDLNGTTNTIQLLEILSGTQIQTNGSLTVSLPSAETIVAMDPGSSAGYRLEGGLLEIVDTLQVGFRGAGTFTQTGGTNNVGGHFVTGRHVGATGTYDLSGGLLRQTTSSAFTIIGEAGTGTMDVRGTGVFSNSSAVRIGLLSGGVGTLTLSDNGQFIAPGIIFGTNAANKEANKLILGLAYNTNFGGPITGAGSLVKDGSSTLTLSSPDNTYTGTTTISNGTLVLSGTHTGGTDYIVKSGATLKGEGLTTSAVVVEAGGNITPGSSPGELTVGDFTLNGTLNIFIDGDSTSLLTVVGGANITGGTVSFSAGAAATEDIYVFLSASGALTQPFASINGLPLIQTAGGSSYSMFYDVDDGIAFLKRDGVTAVAEAIFAGPNAVIGTGSTNFTAYVYNAGSGNVNASAEGDGIDTFGNTGVGVVVAPNSGSELSPQLNFTSAGTTFGTNEATFNAVFDGATNPTTFDIVVYDHASNVVTGTNLTFAPVHQAAAGTVSSTNSITVSNKNDSFRIALGVTNNNTNSYLTIDSVGGLEQGESAGLFGELDVATASLGRVTNTAQLISYDDSDLNGARTNAPGPTIELVSYVYSGQGEWNTPGGGNWTDINQWEVEGGTPGLDGAFSVNDTAFFGTNGYGSVTNTGTVEMLSMTFSNASSAYTIAGSGTITLTASGGSNAAINTLAGTHAVANVISLGSDLTLSNSTGSALDLQGVINGSSGMTKTGAGTTTLTGTNTYTGATTVAGGGLIVSGSIASSAVTVQSGGLLGGSGTVGSLTIESGGTVTPGDLPGTLNINGNINWLGGGNYNWQIVSAEGTTPGTDWGFQLATGQLDLGALTVTSQFNVNLWSLGSTAPEASGVLTDFDPTKSYTWTILTASDGILGYTGTDQFAINTASINGTDGFQNALASGWGFRVVQDGINLNLVYAEQGPEPIPEPGTWAAAALLAGGAAFACWRKRRKAASQQTA